MAIPLFPCAQSIQPVWHRASGMRWCFMVLEVKPASYCESVYIHVRLQQTIQQLEIPSRSDCPYSLQYWSLDSVAMYSTPHGCSGVCLLVSVRDVRYALHPVPGLASVCLSVYMVTQHVAKHDIIQSNSL